MKTHAARKLATVLALGSFISGIPEASGSGVNREAAQIGISQLRRNDVPADIEEQKKLHVRCIEASERAERDAAAMIPGRTWTWRLDFERSRQQLARLRADFTSLHGCETEFEASLTAEQKAKAKAEIAQLASLRFHLEKDAQSLDTELRKGYPTRWHVARDASDMQNETCRWRKLHDQVAKIVGINS